MRVENSSGKKVWKFSYQAWNGKIIQSTFVASEEEVDWIIGGVINFGEIFDKGLDAVIKMELYQFELVAGDAAFAEQFAKTVGSAGFSPFNYLDSDQRTEHDLLFGEVSTLSTEQSIKSAPVRIKPEFSDEGSHVITYDITDDIMNEEIYPSQHQEEMAHFLFEFEIVTPVEHHIHLSSSNMMDIYGDGELHCMKIIKRKSDGVLFGYMYVESLRGYSYFKPNGDKHGVTDRADAYVWLPVRPFTITGYTLDV